MLNRGQLKITLHLIKWIPVYKYLDCNILVHLEDAWRSFFVFFTYTGEGRSGPIYFLPLHWWAENIPCIEIEKEKHSVW